MLAQRSLLRRLQEWWDCNRFELLRSFADVYSCWFAGSARRRSFSMVSARLSRNDFSDLHLARRFFDLFKFLVYRVSTRFEDFRDGVGKRLGREARLDTTQCAHDGAILFLLEYTLHQSDVGGDALFHGHSQAAQHDSDQSTIGQCDIHL